MSIRRTASRGLKGLGRGVLKKLPFQASNLLCLLPDEVLTLGSPTLITLEPTNLCNLKCPLCPRGIMTRERGNMSLADFKTIADQLPGSVGKMELFFMGEPLLNKDIFGMVEYASGKGIETLISTNATILDGHIGDLLNCGLTELLVVLDGAIKETHEKYRVGSDFERTKNAIKKLCKEKKSQGSKTSISLQFVVMKHNEHEIPDVIKLSKELGVDHLVFKKVHLGTWDDIGQRVKMAKEFLPEGSEYRVYDLKADVLTTHRKHICYWAWSSVIMWNGDVTVCCYDYDGQYKIGNIFEDGGFEKIYKSEEYKKLRKKILKQELKLCEKCSYNLEGNLRIY